MENLEVTITHTVAELNVLLEALAEMPFKKVAALVVKLQLAGQAAIKMEGEKTSGEPVEDTPSSNAELMAA